MLRSALAVRCIRGSRCIPPSSWVPALRSSVKNAAPRPGHISSQPDPPSMNLHHLLNARVAAGKPVRVALIGAGKFRSMFLSQVPHTPGLEVPVIFVLDPQRAREACRTVGWDAERIAATAFTSDAAKATSGDIEVIVEATGNPAVGIKHARAAIAAGKHIVMVNVEADVLAGPLLADEARKARGG